MRLLVAAVTGVMAASVATPLVAQPAKVVIGVSSRSFNPGFSNMWIGIPLGLYGKDLMPDAYGTQGASENLQLMLSGQVTMSTGTQDVLFNAAAEGRSLPVVIPCVYLRGECIVCSAQAMLDALLVVFAGCDSLLESGRTGNAERFGAVVSGTPPPPEANDV